MSSEWPEPDPDYVPESRRGISRRALLLGAGIGAAAVVGGAIALSRGRNASPEPSGAPQLQSDGFQYYTVVEPVPQIAGSDWSMPFTQVGGAAATVAMADLARMKQTGLTRDFQCVTGWRVNDVPWSGVLVRDFLAEMEATNSSAQALRFVSFDGEYTESLTMEQAMRDDVLIATSMYGAPVSHERGGPVRLLVVPMYAYKSLKWLGGIEMQTEVTPGYWEVRGWDIDAWVGKSNGRSDEPT